MIVSVGLGVASFRTVWKLGVRAASTVTMPDTSIVELPRIFASVFAAEVTTALAVLTPTASVSEIDAMSAATVAWFRARAWTVKVAVLVGVVSGTSPSNEATVSPATLVSDCRYATDSPPAATLVATESAWFVELARIAMAPPGAE